MPRSCAVKECNRAVFSKGYCPEHYNTFHFSFNGNISTEGIDDMVLLSKLTNKDVVKNLKLRHKNDIIYTYIGAVVVVVNPYKFIDLYSKEHIKRYQFSHPNDLPPHIFQLAEQTYRQLISEEDSQCVIISGESGAGKTEASKQIMQYISAIAPSGSGVDVVKNIILESNPLLEAFGNAKTIRNNNSSRFGKYFEIKFNEHGSPIGGHITNYLLEKSRVVKQVNGERCFHIMYQLIAGAPSKAKEKFVLTSPKDFHYLNQSNCIHVDGINDKKEFAITRHAMKTVGFKGREQEEIFRIVAGVLHLGNIEFKMKRHGSTEGVQAKNGEIASKLLGVNIDTLIKCLCFRHIRTGTKEEYDVPNNTHQACYTRDSVAKAIYNRLFDFIVRRVNNSLINDNAEDALVIGVLDIYGFEVFEKNGFEQFTINYVNEKLQQIFIELTLKSEQEEYVEENITWTPIKYFNNRIVCELIEGKRPPGIFLVLDDVSKTMHSDSKGTDKALLQKLNSLFAQHPHFFGSSKNFLIKHFAGDVQYDVSDFTEKNADTVLKDCLACLKTSTSKLIQVLFPEEIDWDSKKRPTTAGYKIRNASEKLVISLMKCQPHYVRCVKSNDNKKANQFDDRRVEHQIKYLGLLENIKVRRAGFAYRQEYYKFVNRFRILCNSLRSFLGSDKKAAQKIIKKVAKELSLNKSDVQMGKTKIFIKKPETIFALEDLKRKKIDDFARIIQHAWLRYIKTRDQVKLKLDTAKFFEKKGKERRRESFYRPFLGDYLNVTSIPEVNEILILYGEEEILFSDFIEYLHHDHNIGLESRLFIMTKQSLYIIKRVQTPEGLKYHYSLLRHIPLDLIDSISISRYADNFIILHVREYQSPKEQIEWLPDKSTTKCLRCEIPFTLFNRRHHCRLCSRIFCNDCSSKSQRLVDFEMHEPVRVCDDCYGKESTQYLHDQTIKSGKKTEIIALLRQNCKSLKIDFTNHIEFQVKPEATKVYKKKIIFKRSKKRESDNLIITSNQQLEVEAPIGLPVEYVEKRRRNAAKRAKLFAVKRVEEQRLRAEAEALRKIQREEERKRRIAEKKRKKKAMLEKQALEEERVRSKTTISRRPKFQNNLGREDRSNTISAAPCSICECADFRANAFKPKKCVNCFHQH